MINELQKNKYRTFNVEHTGFLRLFYESSRPRIKQLLQQYIDEGRIEMLNQGAVTLHDEACSYYSDILTTMQTGATWFRSHLYKGRKNIKSVGWKMDSFGHSLTSMRLQLANGIENLVINRADCVEKHKRGIENKLFFEWKFNPNTAQNENKTTQAQDRPGKMNTHLLRYHYGFRPAFSTLMSSHTKNPMAWGFSRAVNKVIDVINDYQNLAYFHKHRIIPSLIGDDYRFTGGNEFDTLDFLLIFFKDQETNPIFKNGKIFYSTASKYFKDMEKAEAELKASQNSEGAATVAGNGIEENRDFYPYTNRHRVTFGDGGTWTGFFTTHTWYKQRFQAAGLRLRQLKTYFTKKIFLSRISNSVKTRVLKAFQEAEWFVSILTHHDAITGTSRERVMRDYEIRISQIMSSLIKALNQASGKSTQMEFCQEDCLDDRNQNLESLYSRSFYLGMFSMKNRDDDIFELRVPEDSKDNKRWVLKAQDQTEVVSTLECEPESPRYTYQEWASRSNDFKVFKRLVDGSYARCYRIFSVKPQPNKSTLTFYKLEAKKLSEPKTEIKRTAFASRSFIITNFAGKTETVHVRYINNRTAVQVLRKNNVFEYGFARHQGHEYGWNDENDGPYIMALENDVGWKLKLTGLRVREYPSFYKILVDEYKHGVGTIELRINKKEQTENIKSYKVTHRINKLKKILDQSSEIFVFYRRNQFGNLLEYKTDNNGLDMVQRRFRVRRDKYQELPFRKELNIQPINKIITARSLFSEKEAFGVMVDRPCGATVTQDGSIHILARRITLRDDHKGMPEQMKEDAPVRIEHHLAFSQGGEKTLLKFLRARQMDWENKPIFFKQEVGTMFKLFKTMKNSFWEEGKKEKTFRKVFGDLLAANVQVHVDFEEVDFPKNKILFVRLANLNDHESFVVDGLADRVTRWVSGVARIRIKRVTEVFVNLFGEKENSDDEPAAGAGQKDFKKRIRLGPMDVRAFKLEY